MREKLIEYLFNMKLISVVYVSVLELKKKLNLCKNETKIKEKTSISS